VKWQQISDTHVVRMGRNPGTLIDLALLYINSKIGELWPKVYGLSQPRHCSKAVQPVPKAVPLQWLLS